MTRYWRYGILEDVDTVQQIRVGRFWGVEIAITPLTWLGPLLYFSSGLLLTLFSSHASPASRLYRAGLLTVIVELTNGLHSFGHILSGKMVGSPMDRLLITATRDVNLYHGDQGALPPNVHLVRSLGGPVFNLVVAGAVALLSARFPARFASEFASGLISTNLLFGIGSFLPLPSIDGQVIWRELFRIEGLSAGRGRQK